MTEAEFAGRAQRLELLAAAGVITPDQYREQRTILMRTPLAPATCPSCRGAGGSACQRYQDTWCCAVPETGDRNLRTPPKPDFHGVKLGELRQVVPHLPSAEVIRMDAGEGTCDLRSPGGSVLTAKLEEVAACPVAAPLGVVARWKEDIINRTAKAMMGKLKAQKIPLARVLKCNVPDCSSPIGVALGYSGRCWPCELAVERRKGDVMASGDKRRARALANRPHAPSEPYRNDAAGIGLCGGIWKLRAG